MNSDSLTAMNKKISVAGNLQTACQDLLLTHLHKLMIAKTRVHELKITHLLEFIHYVKAHRCNRLHSGFGSKRKDRLVRDDLQHFGER